jgi:hypothetical protein
VRERCRPVGGTVILRHDLTARPPSRRPKWFDPDGLRPAIVNRTEIASAHIQWLRRNLLRTDGATDAHLRGLAQDANGAPGPSA